MELTGTSRGDVASDQNILPAWMNTDIGQRQALALPCLPRSLRCVQRAAGRLLAVCVLGTPAARQTPFLTTATWSRLIAQRSSIRPLDAPQVSDTRTPLEDPQTSGLPRFAELPTDIETWLREKDEGSFDTTIPSAGDGKDDTGNVSVTHHTFAVTDVSALGVSYSSANSTGSAACLASHFGGRSSCDGGLLLLVTSRVHKLGDHQLCYWHVICTARIRGFRPVERWQETESERHVSAFRTLAGV